MKGENFNRKGRKPRILLAPLDWGLGHATRCIPIIKDLLTKDCEVIIAAEGPLLALLSAEFPSLLFLPLKGYRIRYSRSKAWLPFKIMLQLPRILRMVGFENRWLKNTVLEHEIDAVISDNRPGMYHREIPSVYITHQLLIKAENSLLEKWMQQIHYRYINRFSICWVPDMKEDKNPAGLAGSLSHPEKPPGVPVHYIGPLSRFSKIDGMPKEYDLAILLSGPEPQRTIFEELLLKQLAGYKGKVILIRGLPGETRNVTTSNTAIQPFNHLPASELSSIIQRSALVICRSGYTTIMDLAALQQKAVLVPTPGQTEQEYLAAYLSEKKYFYSLPQKGFDLTKALEGASAFSFRQLPVAEMYKVAINDLLKSL